MTEAVSATVDGVIDALREVVDPCSLATGHPVNIVDLGLVDDVVIGEDVITIKLLLTDPACFFFRDLKRYIADVLRDDQPSVEVRIELVSDKFWTPTVRPLRIDRDARSLLNRDPKL
jgi:metal-sulfur cluster biosynthetic enzyme